MPMIGRILVYRRVLRVVHSQCRHGFGPLAPTGVLRHSTASDARTSQARNASELFFQFARKRPLFSALLSLGTILVVGTIGLVVAVDESDEANVRRVIRLFETSTVQRWDERDGEATIPRAELLAQIRSALRINKPTTYLTFVGASGTGKSTAVRQAIRSLDGHKGVIYFSAPRVISGYSKSFADAIGYRYPQSVGGVLKAWLFRLERSEPTAPKPSDEPSATWQVMETLLLKAAQDYKHTHNGRVPVLVLDAVDRVAKDDTKLFQHIQGFAKDCADEGVLLVVFVFSDGTALPLLESNSAVSRADDSLEIGDLSDAAAIAYLESALQVPHEAAQKLVQTITGGRLALLNKYGRKQVPIANIQQKLHTKTSGELVELGIAPTHELFQVLLRCTRCKTDMAKTLLSTDTLGQLLRKNIISQHPDETYTFHSRHVEVFIRQKVEEQRRAEAEAEERRQKVEEHRRSRSWWERVWGPSSA